MRFRDCRLKKKCCEVFTKMYFVIFAENCFVGSPLTKPSHMFHNSIVESHCASICQLLIVLYIFGGSESKEFASGSIVRIHIVKEMTNLHGDK